MSKNLEKKLRVHLDHEVVSLKIDILRTCVINPIFGARKRFSRFFILSFVHKQEKLSVFHETCRAHIERRDVRAIILFEIL